MSKRDLPGRPVTCNVCGAGGGTLKKIGDGVYQHVDPGLCSRMKKSMEVKALEEKLKSPKPIAGEPPNKEE